MRKRTLLLTIALPVVMGGVVLSLATACRVVREGSSPTPAPAPTLIAAMATATPVPTATTWPTPSATLAALALFTGREVLAGLQPQTYITDVCRYLRERWDAQNSAPGTVVVPVMFHTVLEGVAYRPGETYIPATDLQRTVEAAKRLGFQTITATQLADFLERNARIPPRAMIWILDDRHPDMLEKYFLPIAREQGWTMTLGWIVGDTDHRKGLWKQVEGWSAKGYVDVQSHGYAHYYVADDSPDALVRQELFGPVALLEQHFGYRPIAFVWPGGDVTARSVQLAREAGYRLGFTVFARGPLMYNWVPLGQAERAIGDPLMVLPRFWARPDLPDKLQEAARLGDAAAAQSFRDFAQEAEYYRLMCGCELPVPSGSE